MATSTSASTEIKYGHDVVANDRSARSAADLSALYGGINFDQAAIEGVYKKATAADYAARKQDYQNTAGQYYNRMATSQNTYLDAQRKANASAVMSGASRGMQNAAQLSTILGLSQQSSLDNTKLAQDARLLSDQENAAYAKNASDALTYSNLVKNQLGTLSANEYATDAQKYAAELGAGSAIATANTAASAQGYTADQALQGTQYNADKNLAGTQYTADKNYAGTTYASDKSASASGYAADKGYAGQVAYANGMQGAAAAQAAGQVSAAGIARDAAIGVQELYNLGNIVVNAPEGADVEYLLSTYDNWASDASKAQVDYQNVQSTYGPGVPSNIKK